MTLHQMPVQVLPTPSQSDTDRVNTQIAAPELAALQNDLKLARDTSSLEKAIDALLDLHFHAGTHLGLGVHTALCIAQTRTDALLHQALTERAALTRQAS